MSKTSDRLDKIDFHIEHLASDAIDDNLATEEVLKAYKDFQTSMWHLREAFQMRKYDAPHPNIQPPNLEPTPDPEPPKDDPVVHPPNLMVTPFDKRNWLHTHVEDPNKDIAGALEKWMKWADHPDNISGDMHFGRWSKPLPTSEPLYVKENQVFKGHTFHTSGLTTTKDFKASALFIIGDSPFGHSLELSNVSAYKTNEGVNGFEYNDIGEGVTLNNLRGKHIRGIAHHLKAKGAGNLPGNLGELHAFDVYVGLESEEQRNCSNRVRHFTCDNARDYVVKYVKANPNASLSFDSIKIEYLEGAEPVDIVFYSEETWGAKLRVLDLNLYYQTLPEQQSALAYIKDNLNVVFPFNSSKEYNEDPESQADLTYLIYHSNPNKNVLMPNDFFQRGYSSLGTPINP